MHTPFCEFAWVNLCSFQPKKPKTEMFRISIENCHILKWEQISQLTFINCKFKWKGKFMVLCMPSSVHKGWSLVKSPSYARKVCNLSCYLQNLQPLPLLGFLKRVLGKSNAIAVTLLMTTYLAGSSASHSEFPLFAVALWCVLHGQLCSPFSQVPQFSFRVTVYLLGMKCLVTGYFPEMILNP